jgi:inositol phosphorylceramide mannosyltransferase catalytic subunit
VEQNILSLHKVPTIAHGEASESSVLDGVENRSAFFGRMGIDNDFEHSIPNAWMASPPAHPFFHLMLEWARDRIHGSNTSPEAVTGPIALRDGIQEYTSKSQYHPSSSDESVDGGVDASLLSAVNDSEAYTEARAKTLRQVTFLRPHDIVVLPFHHIYPYSWERDGYFVRDVCWSAADSFNETRCKELLAVDRWPSTAITYWSHSWNANGHDDGNLDKVSI